MLTIAHVRGARRRPRTAIGSAVLVAALMLGGCAAAPDLDGTDAAAFRERVAAVAERSAAGDYAGATAELALLEQAVAEASDAGTLGDERERRITDSVAAVRASLDAQIQAQQAAEQAAREAEAAAQQAAAEEAARVAAEEAARVAAEQAAQQAAAEEAARQAAEDAADENSGPGKNKGKGKGKSEDDDE